MIIIGIGISLISNIFQAPLEIPVALEGTTDSVSEGAKIELSEDMSMGTP